MADNQAAAPLGNSLKAYADSRSDRILRPENDPINCSVLNRI